MSVRQAVPISSRRNHPSVGTFSIEGGLVVEKVTLAVANPPSTSMNTPRAPSAKASSVHPSRRTSSGGTATANSGEIQHASSAKPRCRDALSMRNAEGGVGASAPSSPLSVTAAKRPAKLRAAVHMASSTTSAQVATALNDEARQQQHSRIADAENGDSEGDETEPSSHEINEEAKFGQRLVQDEPMRKPPDVEVRPLLTPFVQLCISPFPNRPHSVAFPPCDAPWEGDPQSSVPSAYVTPSTLDPLPNALGQRKRIGRKKKYGDLVYSIPAGSVRFSSVVAIFGTAGFREATELDSLLPAGYLSATRGEDEEAEDDDVGVGRRKSAAPVSAAAQGSFVPLSLSGSSDAKKWSVRWTKRVEPDEYRILHPLQRVNHFPGTWGIGRKDNLHRHLTKSAQKHGKELYSFHPDAWILPADAAALQRDMQRKQHCPPGMDRNVYIVKQVASACGRRMRLLSQGSVPRGKWIVQRYIDNPLLIYGYKFDLRLYVVVTSYLPLKIYVYDEGLVRFATTPYPQPEPSAGGAKRNMKIKSITAHLTNYSVNKENKDAFVNPTDDGADDERGSKWVLTTVKRYFESHGMNWASVWGRIESLIIKTILSVEQEVVQQLRTYQGIRPQGYSNCFELYGFDVLIRDEKADLEPILMEVNIMPSLSTRCSLLDQRVKANMIADMLTLVGGYSMEKYGKTYAAGAMGWGPAASSASHGITLRSKSFSGAIKAAPVMQTMHPFFAKLSSSELEAVCQAEEEYLRRGHFQRIFPTSEAHDTYKPLFTEIKTLNSVLCQWEKARMQHPPSWTLEVPSQHSNPQSTSCDLVSADKDGSDPDDE